MSSSPRRSKRSGRGLGRDGRRITSEAGEVPGERHSHNPLVRYLRVLGPGLVTGASDDDPSGIATYAVAGASVGTSLLWTAAATFPLMAAIRKNAAPAVQSKDVPTEAPATAQVAIPDRMSTRLNSSHQISS